MFMGMHQFTALFHYSAQCVYAYLRGLLHLLVQLRRAMRRPQTVERANSMVPTLFIFNPKLGTLGCSYMDYKISVVINTYNASAHLREVLESVKNFDEILICDMESTDETCEIAASYGCSIVTFPKNGHRICEPARDFAIHSAKYKWVLVVDADEIVPENLRKYLYAKIKYKDFSDALLIPRINLFLGKPVTSTPDYQLRFFMKDKAYWAPVIHSKPKINGIVKKVPPKKGLSLIHLDNPTVSQKIQKLNTYSDYEVPKRIDKNYGVMKLLFRPFWFFFRSLVLGGGFKDGKRGIAKAYMSAVYQIFLLVKIIEANVTVIPSKYTER